MSEDELNSFQVYWKNYGSWGALLRSPYFWVSVVLTLILFPIWTKPDWWEDVLSVIPNLLGFSLGGYAMFLAFGDKKFQEILAYREKEDTSALMDVSCAFVHFILLQIVSLVLALVCKTYYFQLPDDNFIIVNYGDIFYKLGFAVYFVCYFIFVYAILSTMAATFAIFNATNWYEDHINLSLNEEEKSKNDDKS